ncbi:U1 snRNP protein [Malassezia japonica]|uniref:U1 snRNP protein n=1 Tax=Malassezia japonica TaxID=223818 RepID=A0AAF0F7T3_9BASI|nr:U1 snRNP protein [Malassezia japonica]WFD41291.1 U1 snRNP protein [Malassezia japonica]
MEGSRATTQWVEYKTPQGRPYWYHTGEKKSVWFKPDELKSARERAMDQTPWREYKSGDRSYYVNKDTKQSTWTIPLDLKVLLDTIPDEPSALVPLKAPASPHAAPSNSPGSPAVVSNAATPYVSTPNTGSASPMAVGVRATPRPMASGGFLPVFSNASEAELAFMKMLRDKGVDETWTWEQAIREIVTEPMYKAFKTLAERKAVFTKYVDRLRQMRAEERTEKEASIRPAMVKTLAQNGGLKPYASFATFKKKLSAYSFWEDLEGDEELAMHLYESIRKDARDRHDAAEQSARERSHASLAAFLKTIDMEATTRWRDAHRTIVESNEYKEDKQLQAMSTQEMLSVFQEHMKEIEAQAQSVLDEEKRKRARAGRLARDGFRELLQEQIAQGAMTARSTWAAFVPKIRDDARLQALLPIPGSTPQQLFYDALDELERGFAKHMKSVQEHLQRHPITIDEAHWPAFLAALHADDAPPAIQSLPEHEVRELFDELLYQSQRDARDARRRTERRLRHHVDDLRYAMKKVVPPLDIDASYEVVRPRLETLPEWQELQRVDASGDAARGAWDKFARREHEKRHDTRVRTDYRDLDDTSEERKRKDAPSALEPPPDAPQDPRAVRRRMRYDPDP